jgi:FkbM family methyltransferase
MPSDCGWQLVRQLDLPPGAENFPPFELRVVTATGRIMTVLPLDPGVMGSPEAALRAQEWRQKIHARAESMPRLRLERLIASDPFRRRWQDGPEQCSIAREILANALARRLAPGDEIAVRLHDGDRVLCRPVDDSGLARRYLLDGQDEIGFTRWLAAQAGPGECAIDVGAAYGVMSRRLARAGARVLAIEADALAADRLRRCGMTSPSGGQIDLVECAVSSEPGEVVFAGMGGSCAGGGKILENAKAETVQSFLDEISSLSQLPLQRSVNPADREKRRFTERDIVLRRVPAVTLDACCRDRGMRDVAVVKMDIEGGELEALRGAPGLLGGEFGTPPIIAFEYSSLFPTRGGRREDILDLLATYGYRFWRLAGGKDRGGELIAVKGPEDAPLHDNLIAVPPGRSPRTATPDHSQS